MKLAIACDHAGFPLKSSLMEVARESGWEIVDLGAHRLDPDDDYPDFARYVGQAIQHGHADRGLLICGSGVGAVVAANKLRGIRAALCHDTYSARQSVNHDAVNVLCLGARVIGEALAAELLRAFLAATFHPEPRHQRRIEKIEALESSG